MTLACGGGGTELENMAGRFEVFDCSPGTVDPGRAWCPVAAAGHGPFALPATTEVRVGMTMAVHPRDNPEEALHDVRPAALLLGPDGAKVIDVRGSNDAEKAALLAVVASVRDALETGGTPSIPPDLDVYLGSVATGLHPVTLDAHGGTFQGVSLPASIQRVVGSPWGAAYVVVEQSFGSADSVALISVFPDTPPVVVP